MHPCMGAMHPFRRRQTKLPGMTRDVIDIAAGLVMVKILAKTLNPVAILKEIKNHTLVICV